MIHSFDTKVAEKVGVNCAIILNNLYYWIEKNRANGKNYYDGYYWTYNSTKAFSQLFPYFSQRQIETALKKLRDEEYIITGNYNEFKYDRTLWYAITKKGECILQNCEMDVTSMSNGSDEKGEPIPNSKPNGKPNGNKEINKESEIDVNFENLWKLLKAHPNDRKSKVTKKRKKELYEMGYERVEKAINLYLKIQNPEYYHKRDNILNEIIDNYIDKTEKDFNVEVEEHTASYDISEYEKQTESIPTNTNNQVDTNSKEISDYVWYEIDMKPGEDDYLSKKLAELRKKPEKAIGF